MIENARRWTRELLEGYFERLPGEASLDEAPATLFMGSDDQNDDDEEWTATFGD
jgi:hypothetical protein